MTSINKADRNALKMNVSTKTSAYTMTSLDGVILADSTSAAFQIILPEAAEVIGQIFTIILIKDGGDLTVIPAGDDKLDASDNVLATFADVEDCLEFIAISADRWLILTNIGAVVLSTPI